MKEEIYTKTITKAKLCKAANISTSAIRYWLDQGILTPEQDEANNYYTFNALDILNVHNVIHTKMFDMNLAETKSIRNLSREEFLKLLLKKQDDAAKRIKEYTKKLEYIRKYYNATVHIFETADNAESDFTVVTPFFKYLVETDIYIDEHIRLLVKEPSPVAILFDGLNMSDETSSFCMALLKPPKEGKILNTITDDDKYIVKTVQLPNRDYNEELLQSARKFASEHGYGKVENMIYLPKLHHVEDGKDLFIIDVYFKLS